MPADPRSELTVAGMSMHKVLTLVGLPAAVVLLASASLRELPAHPVSEAPASLEASRILAGQVLHESDALAAPTAIEVAGDRLILADDFADRNVRVLRRSDGAIERSFGKKGRGPREFETVIGIDVIDPSGEIMLYDPMLQRVTWVDLEEDFREDRWVADRSVKLNADVMVLMARWSPSGLVGVGSFPEGRLAHLSPEGRMIQTTGSPPVAPGAVERKVWVRASQSRLKARPDRNRWAVVSRFADRLEIFDAQGHLLAVGDRPLDFDPQDLKRDDSQAVRFGYIDVATTETRIYALFSGRSRADGQANYGGQVHVFDWEGRLLDVWELDTRLIALSVTPDGDELYGVAHHPLPSVRRYALN